MSVLVDTSVLIDQLRGDSRARVLLASAVEAGEPLCASVLTKVEILAGVRPDEEAPTAALLGVLRWIPVDDGIAERAGELARRYLRSHPGVDTVDYVIAATAEALAAPLWTCNVRHFPMFPKLAAPYSAGES